VNRVEQRLTASLLACSAWPKRSAARLRNSLLRLRQHFAAGGLELREQFLARLR
jgi:hypothetical protein